MRRFLSKYTRHGVAVAAMFVMGGPQLEVLESRYSFACDVLDGTRGADWSVLVPGHFVSAADHGAPLWLTITLTYLSNGAPATYERPYGELWRHNGVPMLGADYVFSSNTCIVGGPPMDNNSPIEVSATLEALPQY